MMNALDLIDEFLDVKEEEKETWKIENDLSADWCLDKIREIQAEYNRFELVAKEKIYQLEMALTREREKMEREAGFFEFKLQEYFISIEVNAKETKTQKSYKLPSGVLKLKKATMFFDYDKNKMLEYVEENWDEAWQEQYIKTVKEFKWADFKKTIEIKDNKIIDKETGKEIKIDGLGIDEKPEVFSVEV